MRLSSPEEIFYDELLFFISLRELLQRQKKSFFWHNNPQLLPPLPSRAKQINSAFLSFHEFYSFLPRRSRLLPTFFIIIDSTGTLSPSVSLDSIILSPPSRLHVMVGAGEPVAAHLNVTLLPSRTIMSVLVGKSKISGGTGRRGEGELKRPATA